MITVDIEPAKQRFGRKARKQWKFRISGGNNRTLSDRDTYANTADIVVMIHALRTDDLRIRIHGENGVQVMEGGWMDAPPAEQGNTGLRPPF